SYGSFDFVLVKLASTGDVIWDRQLGGLGQDYVLNLALDDCGNLHSTGFFNQTMDLDPGPGTYNVSSTGGSDIFVATFSSQGDFLLDPQECVTVRVDDGRGGFDTQSFTIDVSSAAPGEIHGTKFEDTNGVGSRDWAAGVPSILA